MWLYKCSFKCPALKNPLGHCEHCTTTNSGVRILGELRISELQFYFCIINSAFQVYIVRSNAIMQDIMDSFIAGLHLHMWKKLDQDHWNSFLSSQHYKDIKVGVFDDRRYLSGSAFKTNGEVQQRGFQVKDLVLVHVSDTSFHQQKVVKLKVLN